jgi:tRNA(fMet)-specific endonuclease VapC
MKYLLDTNIVVHHLRGARRVTQQLRSLIDEGLALSVVSVAELYEGVFMASDPELAERTIRDFLSEVSVLGLDEGVCKVFGRERARLRKLGTPLSDLDLLIASTALYHGLALVTADKAFERVEGLQIMPLVA